MVRRVHVDHRPPGLDLLLGLLLEGDAVRRRERLRVAKDVLDVVEPRDRPEAAVGGGLGLPVDGVLLAELLEGPQGDLLDEGVVARQVDLVEAGAHRGLLIADSLAPNDPTWPTGKGPRRTEGSTRSPTA